MLIFFDVEVRLFQKTIDSAFTISSVVKIQTLNHIVDCKLGKNFSDFVNSMVKTSVWNLSCGGW